ncbi:MAG: hypothetical protein J1E63_03600, partial [Muribaculaceae bacterium]|nr:hypothetical protein [Muribaculaceae bacterium]
MAQDVIVKKDGSTVLCKVLEVNGGEVVYKKWSDLNGANYIMDRSMISNINYQDGRQDQLNAPTNNAYAPGNQQTGNWNYNDNALLALDNARNSAIKNNVYVKKAKNLRIIGWTVGPVLAVSGVVILCTYIDYNQEYIYGGICLALGIATTSTCLALAHKYQKIANGVYSSTLIEKEFKIGNEVSLATGVDLLRDNRFNQSALGVGLRLNF